MKRTLSALGVLAVLCLPADLEAQEDWELPGLWISGGGGYGGGSTTCTRCSTGRQSSFALLFGVGGSASKKLRFGIEGSGWLQSAADTSREYFAAYGVTQFFPVEDFPLSGQIGIGGGRYAEEGAGDVLEAFGFTIQLGASYDIRFGRGLDARIFARYQFSNGLTTRINRQVQFTDLDFNLITAGVALTWTKY